MESCALISAHPRPLHTDPRPTCRESQRPGLLWGSYVSNTISTHMRQEPKPPPCPHPQAFENSPTRGDTQQHGGTEGRWRLLWLAGGWWARRWGPVIALGGSSNPALCTSHTGAGGAPCSGRTRLGHRASPGVSAERKEDEGPVGEGKGPRERQKHRVKEEERGRERQAGGVRRIHREGPERVCCSHRGCFTRHQGPSCLSLSPEAQAEVLDWGQGCRTGSCTHSPDLDATALPQHALSSHHLKLTKVRDKSRIGAQILPR